MLYKDFVYNEVEITESIILELINCSTIQRLKKIDQGGHPPLWAKQTATADLVEHSRFSHSIGVYVLLKKYKAPLEEQIAGLIHDASHSAFSHAVDYVMKMGTEHNQSHQDDVFEDFIRKSEIPKILEKYGFDLEKILDDSNFPLKERDLPDLCADRIDYVLRGSLFFNETTKEEIDYILSNLDTEDKRWVFKNYESAKKFAEIFENMNRVYFSGEKSAIMFMVTRDYLRYALDKNYINNVDLYSDDKELIEKINNNLNDQKLKILWERMEGRGKVENKPDEYSSEIICKSRVVDPLFKNNNQIKKLSEVDKEWAKVVESESKPKKYHLKFIDIVATS